MAPQSPAIHPLAGEVTSFYRLCLPPHEAAGGRHLCCPGLAAAFESTLFHWAFRDNLKNDVDSWDETFCEHKFSPKASEKMKHFNIRYE
jgi:hypothetical protein